jgi:putative methanogen marker protein 4
MDIIKALEKVAQAKKVKIAIGAGIEREGYVNKIIEAAEIEGEVTVVTPLKFSSNVNTEVVESKNVENYLVELVKKGRVDVAIRGSGDAKRFIQAIKNAFNTKISRIAILESPEGKSFMLAPVGIDEGWSIEDKTFLISEGTKILMKLGLTPRIGILSGGRKQDYGRHALVDKTLDEAEFISSSLRNVKNYSILIEDAIKDGANFIIAPNGITGNLIFRTLVFIGNGKGYGAPIVGVDKCLIDTSRANSVDGYLRAFKTAKALS